MRIGLTTSVIDRGRSGIAQYVFALLRAWAAQPPGHQFILFVLENDLPLFDRVNTSMQLVPVPERFRPPARNILWHQRQLQTLALAHGLDVLHVPSYRRMPWARACPTVATIHDLAFFRVPRKYDWKRMLYGRFVARALAWRQDEIITISHTTAKDVTRYFGLSNRRLTVIHNGVDHDRFSPSRSEAERIVVRQQFGIQSPFFLYVARLEHPAKNHVSLIEAFNRFRTRSRTHWQLVLAGGDWHGAEFIHAAVRRSPFRKDIRLLGFVPDGELPALYRAADLFVYPSLYEGFGLPLVEAMACGCPVLSSKCGALAEVAPGAETITNPRDPEALALALERLGHDQALRRQSSASGLEWARRFDWNTTAAQTLDVYARAAERATTRGRTRAAAGPGFAGFKRGGRTTRGH